MVGSTWTRYVILGVLMAGDWRYGGFDNPQLAAYLGVSVPEVQMLQELMQGQGTVQDMALAQQFAGQKHGVSRL